MTTNWLPGMAGKAAKALLLVLLSGVCFAEQNTLIAAVAEPILAPSASITVAQPQLPAPHAFPEQHKFWDRQNKALFAAVVIMDTADFTITHSNLRRGGTEYNPIARMLTGSTPGQVVNFASEAAGTIALSYMFHKTGHHRLERITSLINIGTSGMAVGYGVTHR